MNIRSKEQRAKSKEPHIQHWPIIYALCSMLYALCSLCASDIFSQDAGKGYRLHISINEARLIAIHNNFDIKLAKLDAKIKGTELSYKESVFDTILNGEIEYTDDQKKRSSSLYGSKATTNEYNVGIDKKLRTGTDVEIDWTNTREWTDSEYVSTNPYHESELSISLTQPIAKNFFGLIDRGNIEIVKQEIKNAELDSYIDIENALLSTEKTYWKVVLLQEEFEVKKGILKKSIKLFNQHRKKLKIGMVETGDVLASEANMHIRITDLLIARNELKKAEELLKFRLNLNKDMKLYLTDTLPMPQLDTDFIRSLKTAFENRRDYKSKKNDIEAKNIKLALKSNSRFPEIDLKATFAQNGISSKYYKAIEDIFEDSNPEYSVGIEFSFPLENNEAKSEYEKACLEKTKAIVSLQKAERQLITDIDEKFRTVRTNKINIKNMRYVEFLQKGKLFQEENRFKYGRSNSDTLIRYQEDLLNAQLTTKKAYYDYRIAMLELMDVEDSFLGYIGLE